LRAYVRWSAMCCAAAPIDSMDPSGSIWRWSINDSRMAIWPLRDGSMQARYFLFPSHPGWWRLERGLSARSSRRTSLRGFGCVTSNLGTCSLGAALCPCWQARLPALTVLAATRRVGTYYNATRGMV